MTRLELADALDCYGAWPRPTVIISDGPYGIGGYPGDPATPAELPALYRPHAAAWAAAALPSATLWFWCTEVGWAMAHPVLEAAGWVYRALHVWDKGIGHVAGNCNTRTLRQFPIVTEVCGQYVRDVHLEASGEQLPLKAWLRREWARTGLPFAAANAACGVKDAATRKYLDPGPAWYAPPPEIFGQLAAYANEHGAPALRPYFSVDGVHPLGATAWGELRAKFYCPAGVSNVWHVPAVRGRERIKLEGRAQHANQKPLALMTRIITASSDPGDVVWEPFGGLASGLVAASSSGRRGFGAEVEPAFFELAQRRMIDLHDHHGDADRNRRPRTHDPGATGVFPA